MGHRAVAPQIVCFGDSLTAGYQTPTPAHPAAEATPYGEFLAELLGHYATVWVSGVCGELTGEMLGRFGRDVLARKPAYVVILGGTNDLGWNARPTDIMRNLLKMFELARSTAIQPVAVTVPSIRAEEVGEGGGEPWLGDHIARRLALNSLIREYCESKSVPWVDLFAATAEPETLMLASRFSNDGLHLTTAGYRLLASLLYERVFAPALGLARTSEGPC